MDFVDIAFYAEKQLSVEKAEKTQPNMPMICGILGEKLELHVILSIETANYSTQFNYALLNRNGSFFKLDQPLYARLMFSQRCPTLTISLHPKTHQLQFKFMSLSTISFTFHNRRQKQNLIHQHLKEIRSVLKKIEEFTTIRNIGDKQKQARLYARLSHRLKPNQKLKHYHYFELTSATLSKQNPNIAAQLHKASVTPSLSSFPSLSLDYFSRILRQVTTSFERILERQINRKSIYAIYKSIRLQKGEQKLVTDILQKWQQIDERCGTLLELKDDRCIKIERIGLAAKERIYKIIDNLKPSTEYTFLPKFFPFDFAPGPIIVSFYSPQSIPLPHFLTTHPYLSLITRLKLWFSIVSGCLLLWERQRIIVKFEGLAMICVLPNGMVQFKGIEMWTKISQVDRHQGYQIPLLHDNMIELAKLYFYMVYPKLPYTPTIYPFPAMPPIQVEYTFIQLPLLGIQENPPYILLDLIHTLQRIVTCQQVVCTEMILEMCSNALDCMEMQVS